ncbi:MAG: type II toxin-antitoxin system HicA family toxin [Acidobacteria bacterium]|nr:type II toxin-antitoxin system HicA family toxin [Acidobacteriota bacterium]
MRPVDWKELVSLCEAEGCRRDRERGDHYIMTKPGLARPVVIPKKKDLAEDISLSIGRTLGLSRKQLEQKLSRKPKRVSGAKSPG